MSGSYLCAKTGDKGQEEGEGWHQIQVAHVFFFNITIYGNLTVRIKKNPTVQRRKIETSEVYEF